MSYRERKKGRPYKYDEPTNRIVVRVPDSILQGFNELCKSKNLTKSDEIVRMLRNAVSRFDKKTEDE